MKNLENFNAETILSAEEAQTIQGGFYGQLLDHTITFIPTSPPPPPSDE